MNENSRARFEALAREIDQFMRYKSSTTGVEEQATFTEIISMEEEGLTFLLNDLDHGLGSPHWRFLAIHMIAENRNLPEIRIPPDQAGRIDAIMKIFLQWGRDNNFIF